MQYGSLTFALLISTSSALFWGHYGLGTGITYQLYTRFNPVNGQALVYGNENSVAFSNLNRNNPTR